MDVNGLISELAVIEKLRFPSLLMSSLSPSFWINTIEIIVLYVKAKFWIFLLDYISFSWLRFGKWTSFFFLLIAFRTNLLGFIFLILPSKWKRKLCSHNKTAKNPINVSIFPIASRNRMLPLVSKQKLFYLYFITRISSCFRLYFSITKAYNWLQVVTMRTKTNLQFTNNSFEMH